MYEVRVKCQSGETNPTNSQMEFHLDSGHRRLVYDAVPRSQSCQMASDHRTNHTKTKRKWVVDVVIRRTGTARGTEEESGDWELGTWYWKASQTCLGQWPTRKRVQTNLIIAVRLYERYLRKVYQPFWRYLKFLLYFVT